MTGVYHQPFIVWRVNQSFKKFFPNTLIPPTNEATVSVAPSTKIRWKIAPRCTSAHNPKNGIDEQSIVSRSAAPASFASRQMRLKLFPNMIRNIVSSVCWCWHNPSHIVTYRISMPAFSFLVNLVTTLPNDLKEIPTAYKKYRHSAEADLKPPVNIFKRCVFQK